MTDRPSCTVLLVEDQDLLRSATALLVNAAADFSVVGEAATGEAAVERARVLRPDVVVMDLRLPGRGGVWATREICRETDARVLVLTTFGDDDHVLAALEAGASGFVTKDISAADLLETLRAVAAGGVGIDPGSARVLLERARSAGALEAGAPSGHPAWADGLSPREVEVASLVGTGASNAEIASALWVSEATVKTHLANVLRKSGHRDRLRLAVGVARQPLRGAGG